LSWFPEVTNIPFCCHHRSNTSARNTVVIIPRSLQGESDINDHISPPFCISCNLYQN